MTIHVDLAIYVGLIVVLIILILAILFVGAYYLEKGEAKIKVLEEERDDLRRTAQAWSVPYVPVNVKCPVCGHRRSKSHDATGNMPAPI